MRQFCYSEDPSYDFVQMEAVRPSEMSVLAYLTTHYCNTEDFNTTILISKAK